MHPWLELVLAEVLKDSYLELLLPWLMIDFICYSVYDFWVMLNI
jgi:hypothetical protein